MFCVLNALVFGAREADTLSLEGFRNIVNTGVVDIDVTIGDTYSIVISANEGKLDMLVAEQEGETLYLKVKSGTIINADFKAEITMPALERIKIDGSGDVSVSGRNAVDTLAVSIEGSGDVVLDENISDELLLEINGSGDIKITGEAREISARISGSGDIDVGGINVSNAQTSITGSGDINLGKIDGELKAKIVGSGDITYEGDPEVNRIIIGSGELKKR